MRVARRLLKLDKKYGAQNYKSTDVIIRRGEGIYMYDVNDKKYYDYLSSYSSLNQGHCHPRLVEAMEEQSKKLTLCSRAYYSEELSEFYGYMHSMFGYDRCLPMNTGVEGTETAIKLARLWGYKEKGIPSERGEIIVAKENFWGRSIAACSSSTDPLCYRNFGPYVPGFNYVNYNDLNDLELTLTRCRNAAGFVIEPIQGEAGVKVPSDDYLKKARALCDKYNVLMICDEVQTGLGRTGKVLASQDASPDMVVLGKALSGGMMPISCVLGNNKVMDLIEAGSHGSTYGGNPLAARLARVAIDIIFKENLITNSRVQGKKFRKGLKRYVKKGILKDVRGKGLLNAIEFWTRGEAEKVVDKFRENGLLTKITRGSTVRMCPPLIINNIEMEESLEIIKESIKVIE